MDHAISLDSYSQPQLQFAITDRVIDGSPSYHIGCALAECLSNVSAT